MPMNYQYLPEMQGVTQNQQQEYSNKMNVARDRMNKSMSRSPLQSSGSYLQALSSMNAKQAQGLSAIERENIYKNALLGREERLKKEAYERQKDWYKYQQDQNWDLQERQRNRAKTWGWEDALGNYLGATVGSAANKLGNYVSGGLANMAGGKDFGYDPNEAYNAAIINYITKMGEK
jgi:hypothetical protein